MRWEWVRDGKVFRALRAVDTATHPDYQGKGIFKKLTLALVNKATSNGDHFVFNTPNGQSKPGYLKMGWIEAGKLPIRMSVRKPAGMLLNWIQKNPQTVGDLKDKDLKYYLRHPGLPSLLKICRDRSAAFTTHASPEYLNWRYIDVPVADYVAVGVEHGELLTGLVIARVKGTRLGRELRITDCFSFDEKSMTELMKKFRECKAAWNIDYTTLAGTERSGKNTIVGRISLKAAFGPAVTIRPLAMTDLSDFMNFRHWSSVSRRS